MKKDKLCIQGIQVFGDPQLISVASKTSLFFLETKKSCVTKYLLLGNSLLLFNHFIFTFQLSQKEKNNLQNIMSILTQTS